SILAGFMHNDELVRENIKELNDLKIELIKIKVENVKLFEENIRLNELIANMSLISDHAINLISNLKNFDDSSISEESESICSCHTFEKYGGNIIFVDDGDNDSIDSTSSSFLKDCQNGALDFNDNHCGYDPD